MKRILIVLLIGLLIGCSAETNNNSTNNAVVNEDNAPSVKEMEEKTKVGVNEPATHEGVVYTVSSVEYSTGSEWDEPAAGKEYVIVTIQIENKSDKEISYNPFDWFMVNSMGQKDNTAFTIIDTDTALNSGDLMPGGSVSGTLVFEEPIDDSNLTLLYYENMFFDDSPTLEFIIQ